MGPLQRKVLRVLSVAEQCGCGPLDHKQIAAVINDVWGLNVSPGSASAALSGMRKFGRRYWVKRWSSPRLDARPFRTTIRGRPREFYPFETAWSITDRGLYRLSEVA